MDSRRGPLFASGYAVASAAIALLDPPSILAIVVLAPLVLLVPGLSLVMALDIDGDPSLPGRRLVVSVALSIAVTALGGILVNTVAPLTRASWLVWLVGFTCVCSAITFLGAGRARMARFPRPTSRSLHRPRVEGLWRWVAVGVAGLCLAGAAVLTEITSRNAYNTPLVELSLQPMAGTHSGQVELSIANRSDHTADLRLTIDDGHRSNKVTSVTLPASHRWTAAEPVGSSGLRAVLRKAGRPTPIAEVIWNGLMPRRSPVGGARR